MSKRTISEPIVLPRLDTERLTLAPLGLHHGDGMYRLWSEEAVCRFVGPVNDYAGNPIAMPAVDHASSDAIIDFWVSAAKDGWGFRWAVLLAGSGSPVSGDGADGFVGTVGFNSVGACAEIAYHLVPRWWHSGYMTEACTAAIQWQAERGSRQFEAFIESENLSSIALARRLGLSLESEGGDGLQRYFLALT